MRTSSGYGLARGPAALVGGVLLAFGLAAMIGHNDFPSTATSFPDGTPQGDTFLGIEVNGWTNWFCAVVGSVVLFGSGQQLVARFFSLLAGLALGGAALLGLVNGNVVGLAATNDATVIAFAAAGGVLLLNVFSPRVGRRAAAEQPVFEHVTVEHATYAPATENGATREHATT